MKGRTLYFIYNRYTGLVKIGISENLNYRVRALEQACGVNLDVLGFLEDACEFEKSLHEAFHQSRAVGEWFRPTDELISLAKAPSVKAIMASLALHRADIEAREADIERQRKARQLELAEQKRLRDEARRKKEKTAAERKRREEDRRQKREQARAAERHAEMERWQKLGESVIARHELPKSAPAIAKDAVLPKQRARNLQFAGIAAGVTRVQEVTQ